MAPGTYRFFIFYVFVVLNHRHCRDMMPGRHYILHFFVGLIFSLFLELDAVSLLNITIEVNVNEKTAIDQSYPTGKLIRHVLMVIYIVYSNNFVN